MPGSFRSVSTRCTVSEASSFNPVSASPAESVLNPSSPRFSSSSRRILASSSIIRMVGIVLVGLGRAGVGTGALPRPSRAKLSSCQRLYGFLKRKEKRKHRTALRRVLNMDRPVMSVHDLRNDGEAEPDAGFLRGHKRIENFFSQIFRYAGTAVGKTQLNSLAIVLRDGSNVNPQRSAVIFVLHGFVSVLHEIKKGLLAQAFVERNERQSTGIVAFDAHRFPRKTRSDNLQDTIKQGGQVRGIRLRMKRTSEVQKLGNQSTQPIDLSRNVAGQFAGKFVGGLQFLRQHFRRALDDAKRIANLVSQSSR